MQDKERIIVLDESLNQLSPMYRAKASEFISSVCNDLNFTVILINFDEYDDFGKSADRVYEAYRYSGSETKFRKLK
jgi:ABC-type thiamine transport system ATPase subunit